MCRPQDIGLTCQSLLPNCSEKVFKDSHFVVSRNQMSRIMIKYLFSYRYKNGIVHKTIIQPSHALMRVLLFQDCSFTVCAQTRSDGWNLQLCRKTEHRWLLLNTVRPLSFDSSLVLLLLLPLNSLPTPLNNDISHKNMLENPLIPVWNVYFCKTASLKSVLVPF